MSSKLAINDLTFSEDLLDSELQSINGGKSFFKKLTEAGEALGDATGDLLEDIPPIATDLLPCAIGATVGGVPGCLAADYVVNS
jgi:hypothetical protein